MIKVIFWDIGGVLILSRRKQILEDWAQKLNISSNILRSTLKQFSDQRMKGVDLSFDDFVKQSDITWITGKQLENFQKSLWDSEYVNKELLNYILENKNKYKYGVITNNYKEAEEIVLKKYKIPKFYNIFVSSSNFSVLKPDRKIYDLALKQINLPATQCLFIDDSLENVKGARKIGMFGIQYQNNNQIFKEIEKLFL